MMEFEHKARCTKVYDGDTITADILVGFGVVLEDQKLRLYGINTPEVRGDMRPWGLEVRDYVRDLIFGKEFRVRTDYKKCKYGRWLVDVYVDPVDNLNQHLVEAGLAVEYMR